MNKIYIFLDNLFYSTLAGHAGTKRRYRLFEAIDRFQYKYTRSISTYFHLKHCKECKKTMKILIILVEVLCLLLLGGKEQQSLIAQDETIIANPCESGFLGGDRFWNASRKYWCVCDGTNDVRESDGTTPCF